MRRGLSRKTWPVVKKRRKESIALKSPVVPQIIEEARTVFKEPEQVVDEIGVIAAAAPVL